MLTNGAGVEKHQIGIIGPIAKIEADILEPALEFFRIANVLLATVGMDKGEGLMIVSSIYNRFYLIGKPILLGYYLLVLTRKFIAHALIPPLKKLVVATAQK